MKLRNILKGQRNRLTTLAFLMAACCLHPSMAGAQNLVTNGDFESFGLPVDPNYEIRMGNPYFTGWNRDGGSFGSGGITFLIPSGSTTFAGGGVITPGFTLTSPAGGNYYASDSDPNYSGSLWQSISGLTVGQQYKLSFYEGLMSYYNLPMDAQWNVTFGADTQVADLMHMDGITSVDWHPYEMTFTATSDTQVLKFESLGSVNVPPAATLDGISLVAVPEPSSAVLVGACGMATLLRRRRR